MLARLPLPAGARRWELLGVAGLALALVVAGILLTVNPADPVGTADTADARTGSELQGLLDRWGAAIRSGDRAVLGTIVDDTAPEVLDAQRRRLDAIAAVPLADYGYELGPEPPLPVDDGAAAGYDNDPLRAHRVYLRHAVGGIDDRPTYRPLTVLFVQRPDGWRIADDAFEAGPDPSNGHGPAPSNGHGLWDHGPLYVVPAPTAGGRSLVIGHPERAAFVDAVASELASAVDAVSGTWGDDWARRALVVVTSSRDEFTDLVGPRHNGDDIAAVAVSDAVDPARGTATGQRIVFSPAAGSRLGPEALRAVLRHEMVHIAARAETVDGSPMWILEGYADYIGHRDARSDGTGEADVRRIAPTLTARVLDSGAPAGLPADEDFSGADSRIAYEAAWSIAAFTAAEFGPGTLTELYRAFATGPAADEHVDEVLEALVGLDSSGFVDRWGGWLSERVGGR